MNQSAIEPSFLHQKFCRKAFQVSTNGIMQGKFKEQMKDAKVVFWGEINFFFFPKFRIYIKYSFLDMWIDKPKERLQWRRNWFQTAAFLGSIEVFTQRSLINKAAAFVSVSQLYKSCKISWIVKNSSGAGKQWAVCF